MSKLYLTHDENVFYGLRNEIPIIHINSAKDYSEDIVRTAAIVVILDGDKKEVARRIGIKKCWVADIVEYNIVDEKPFPVNGIYTFSDTMDDLKLAQEGKIKPAYGTGWPEMNEFYRVRAGELSIVTGYPGSGKSEFIDNLCLNMVEKCGWRMAICSFENDLVEHWKKFAERICRCEFPKADLEKVKKALDHKIFMLKYKHDGMKIDNILELADVCILRYGINGLVIDPYNWIEHQRKASQTETEYVSDLLTKIQRFAQDRQIHIWFVAHPAKPPTGAISYPGLYSISGSAHWANKADVGISVHRKQLDDLSRSDIMKVVITKVRYRDSGKEGKVYLRYFNHRLEVSPYGEE